MRLRHNPFLCPMPTPHIKFMGAFNKTKTSLCRGYEEGTHTHTVLCCPPISPSFEAFCCLPLPATFAKTVHADRPHHGLTSLHISCFSTLQFDTEALPQKTSTCKLSCFWYSKIDVFIWIPKARLKYMTLRDLPSKKNSRIKCDLLSIFKRAI